jgi:outer membrane biosynthesis protein TonB
VTVGLIHPWILLPTEHRLWEAERLRSVLLHECAHVRRGDCLIQWLPNIVCALNWFNPAAWMARAEMLCESERACDDAVIRSGITGNAFAQDLVDIARSIQLKGNSLMSTALTTKLERRIQRLIDPSADRRPLSVGRTVLGVALALVLLAPVAGVRADQVLKVQTATAVAQETPEPAAAPEPAPAPRIAPAPTPVPRKTLRVVTEIAQAAPPSPAAHSAQPPATGSISGVVSDPTGAVVPNAMVRINSGSGDSSTVYNTVTNAIGQWSLNSIAAGTYGLSILAPGFATINKTVTVSPGANDQGVSHLTLGRISESLTITAQASNSSATAQARTQGSPRPIRVGGNVQAAKLIHRVDPIFPQSARDRGVQGPVTIQAIIGKDGFIRDTFASQGPADLVLAAVDAVRLWQFEPTRLNGEPVEIMTEVTVNFQLQ